LAQASGLKSRFAVCIPGDAPAASKLAAAMAFGHSYLAAFACAVSLLAGAGADKAFLAASAPKPGVEKQIDWLRDETTAEELEASSAVENDSKDEPEDALKEEPTEEEEQQQQKEEMEEKIEKEEEQQQKEEEETQEKKEKEQEQEQHQKEETQEKKEKEQEQQQKEEKEGKKEKEQEQEQEGEGEQGEHGGEEEEEKETGTAPSESEDCSSKGGNPMLKMVLDMAPQCFQTCPKMCSVISKVLGQFSAVPDKSVIKDQVCKYQEVFSCALENVDACKAVLTPGATFGVPQDNDDLRSLQCGAVAKDMKPKDAKDATSSAAHLGGATVMMACLLLASTLQHLA